MKHLRQMAASIAARYLTRHRVLTERERIRAKAREMCRDMGRPIPKVLR